MTKSKETIFDKVSTWELLDKPAQFIWVEKELILVDASYQRDICFTSKVYSMIKGWSWVACGALIVGRRKGTGELYAVDGQHRHAAALKLDWLKKLPCLVFETDGPKEEAALFLSCNLNRSVPKASQTFRAGLVSENKIDLLLNQLVESHGRFVSTRGGRKQGVSCISLLRESLEKDESLTREVFAMTHAICADEHFHENIFKGLFYLSVMCQKKGIEGPNSEEYLNAWKTVGRSGCLMAIKKVQIELSKGSVDKVCAKGLRDLANKLVKKKKLPNPYDQ